MSVAGTLLALLLTPVALVAPGSAAARAMLAAPDVEELARSVAVIEHAGGIGAGFLVAPDLVLTAAHVAPAGPVRLRFDGVRTGGTVVSADAGLDVALIRIEPAVGATPLEIATTPPRLGEEVLVIGAPLGTLSVTRGIVSSVDDETIQTDASVNPGNSGGPLLRPDGQVLGLVTQKRADAEGIGFAVAAQRLEDFLERSHERSAPSAASPDAGAQAPPRAHPAPEESDESGARRVLLFAAGVVALGLATLALVAHRLHRTTTDEFQVRLGPATDTTEVT